MSFDDRFAAGITILLSLLVLSGCSTAKKVQSEPSCPKPRVVMEAKYSATPVVIDGKLDDQAWKNAKVYQLYLSKDLYTHI